MAGRLICMCSIIGCVFTAAVDVHTTAGGNSLRLETTWTTASTKSSSAGVGDVSDISSGGPLSVVTDEWTEAGKDVVTTVNPERSNPSQAARFELSTGSASEQDRELTFQGDVWDVDATTTSDRPLNTVPATTWPLWPTSFDPTVASTTSPTPTSTADTVATPGLRMNFVVTKYSTAFDADPLDASAESVKNEESPDPWPWLLFILNGNTTVASRRQRDLGTYLRLNLAARLDADYNDVVINRILLTQTTVMANISVDPSHLVGVGAIGLDALSQGNVTLLELSGQEFLVDRIIRADEFADQRGVSAMDVAAMVDSELTVYGAVGAVFVFLLLALFLGLVFHGPCQSLDKYPHQRAAGDNLRLDHQQGDSAELKCPSPGPPVIYTEQLAREMDDAVNLLDVGAHYNRGVTGAATGAAVNGTSRNCPSVWYSHVLPSLSLKRGSDVMCDCPTIDNLMMKTVDLQIDDDIDDGDRRYCQEVADGYRQMEADFQRMMRQPMDSSSTFL